MAVVVPINGQEVVEYIFDNAEKVPNDFYLCIMNLMKIYYEENGNNLQIIHEYLNLNKKRIDKTIIKKISDFLKKEDTPSRTKRNCECSCKINLGDCPRNSCNVCIETGNCLFHFFKFIFIPLFFAVFIGSLIWVFVTKR
jgi:hypothetical protein